MNRLRSLRRGWGGAEILSMPSSGFPAQPRRIGNLTIGHSTSRIAFTFLKIPINNWSNWSMNPPPVDMTDSSIPSIYSKRTIGDPVCLPTYGHSAPAALLARLPRSIPIPQYLDFPPLLETSIPFSSISVDLITGLPLSAGFDSVMVMVNHGLMKGVIYCPCTKDIDMAGVASLFFKHVFPQFSLHSKVISNWGPQFALAFARKLA